MKDFPGRREPEAEVTLDRRAGCEFPQGMVRTAGQVTGEGSFLGKLNPIIRSWFGRGA